MKTNENQKSTREYKVYIHRLKTWVEVTEEQYYAYYRDIWATRKRAQAHGQCMCPKSKTWMCDGDCLACEFRTAGDNLSLDYTVEDGEGNQKSWADDLPDDAPNAQSFQGGEQNVRSPEETRHRHRPGTYRCSHGHQRGVKATGYEAGADSKSIYGRRKTG